MNISDVKTIVLDIEGTVGSISFVKDVMFPYAAERIPAYARANEGGLKGLFDEVRAETKQPELDTEGCIAAMLGWMKADQKVTPLKTMQGMVWKEGFEGGDFKGHLYADVAPALTAWHDAGATLAIYSSGSVGAQKLYFTHSDAGNLTPLLSGYFDTKTGAKQEAGSYTKIAAELKTEPAQCLFLSDHPAELAAAQAAGFQVVGLNRPGQALDLSGYPVVESFSELDVKPAQDNQPRAAYVTPAP